MPVYEFIDGERRELSDADLEAELQKYKPQTETTVKKGRVHVENVIIDTP